MLRTRSSFVVPLIYRSRFHNVEHAVRQSNTPITPIDNIETFVLERIRNRSTMVLLESFEPPSVKQINIERFIARCS